MYIFNDEDFLSNIRWTTKLNSYKINKALVLFIVEPEFRCIFNNQTVTQIVTHAHA